MQQPAEVGHELRVSIAAAKAIVVPTWATNSFPSPGWTTSSAASIVVSCGLSAAAIKNKSWSLAKRLL